MKPRASIPTTLSTLPRPKWTTIRSITVENAISSASSGVMSLNTIPCFGKSGTSRISDFRRSRSVVTSAPHRRRRLAAVVFFFFLGLEPAGRPGAPPQGPGPDLLVPGLPFLQQGQRGRGDEDRRVRPGGNPDEQREREVLQGGAAEQQQRQDRQQHDQRGVHRSHQ